LSHYSVLLTQLDVAVPLLGRDRRPGMIVALSGPTLLLGRRRAVDFLGQDKACDAISPCAILNTAVPATTSSSTDCKAVPIIFQCCHCMRAIVDHEPVMMLKDSAYCSRQCQAAAHGGQGSIARERGGTGGFIPHGSGLRRAPSCVQRLSTATDCNALPSSSSSWSLASIESSGDEAAARLARGPAVPAAVDCSAAVTQDEEPKSIFRVCYRFFGLLASEVLELLSSYLQSVWVLVLTSSHRPRLAQSLPEKMEKQVPAQLLFSLAKPSRSVSEASTRAGPSSGDLLLAE